MIIGSYWVHSLGLRKQIDTRINNAKKNVFKKSVNTHFINIVKYSETGFKHCEQFKMFLHIQSM